MSDNPDESAANSLGLTLESIKLENAQAAPPAESTDTDAPTKAEEPVAASTEEAPADDTAQENGASEDASTSADATPASPTAKKEKKQPYVNPHRVKTGGAQRVRIVLSLREIHV